MHIVEDRMVDDTFVQVTMHISIPYHHGIVSSIHHFELDSLLLRDYASSKHFVISLVS